LTHLGTAWHTYGMTNTRYANRTIEARIWGVSGSGMVKLYTGGRDGILQLRTSLPLAEADQRTWFKITTNDEGVIVAITI
jgi:hypothetical protein